MTNVYVVLDDRWSRRNVVGVFSTQEAAERAIGDDCRGDFGLEGFALDALAGHVIGPRWLARVDLEDGGIEIRELCNDLRHPTAAEVDRPRGTKIDVISPISEEHAKQVAIEKRKEWLKTRVGQT